MENGPFEDVFPIENGDIPASYVSLPEGSRNLYQNLYLIFSTPPGSLTRFGIS